MNAEGIFALLSPAPFGVYAMSLDQTILFWNPEAERILGFSPEQVVGRRCYDVVAGQVPGGFTPACVEGCPSITALRAGGVPGAATMQMRSASGEHKTVRLTPMIAVCADMDAPLLVHLFDDGLEAERTTDGIRSKLSEQGVEIVSDDPAATPGSTGTMPLTARELEVLRLVALGRETQQIADELGISLHTVRNHVRHFRRKLNATTKLQAVLTAMRIGILG